MHVIVLVHVQVFSSYSMQREALHQFTDTQQCKNAWILITTYTLAQKWQANNTI